MAKMIVLPSFDTEVITKTSVVIRLLRTTFFGVSFGDTPFLIERSYYD